MVLREPPGWFIPTVTPKTLGPLSLPPQFGLSPAKKPQEELWGARFYLCFQLCSLGVRRERQGWGQWKPPKNQDPSSATSQQSPGQVTVSEL